ncbi:hypothetical protein HJO_12681 [Hyphomonas johnsonii MHS-2]|uniref:Uncharacterized protein n=1 Tax=Hyphomonas johnsonii MHS-2 TaxID=1280950 RepID=A0A059FJJ8_9PROT|nr:hypothetical protein HJO_12681 [Hyphomonas johnsonii MHS-2]
MPDLAGLAWSRDADRSRFACQFINARRQEGIFAQFSDVSSAQGARGLHFLVSAVVADCQAWNCRATLATRNHAHMVHPSEEN